MSNHKLTANGSDCTCAIMVEKYSVLNGCSQSRVCVVAEVVYVNLLVIDIVARLYLLLEVSDLVENNLR